MRSLASDGRTSASWVSSARLMRIENGGRGRATLSSAKPRKEHAMLDLILLAVGLGFFALSVGYAYACDRL